MRIILFSVFLSLLITSGTQGMSHVKGAAVGTAVGGSSTLAGIGYGAMVGGPGGALVGGIIGTLVGAVGGMYGGVVVQDNQEKLDNARKERAAQEARGECVSAYRIGKALDAQVE